VREVQRDSRAQVFDLLGKAVGQPRKPAHLHTHGQVLPRPGTGIPFPIMRGESPRGLDTKLYGETNDKDSWGPRSLWPTRRFWVNSREVALSETRNPHGRYGCQCPISWLTGQVRRSVADQAFAWLPRSTESPTCGTTDRIP
jgi:hypothetical protein